MGLPFRALVSVLVVAGSSVVSQAQQPALDLVPALERYHLGQPPGAVELATLAAMASDGRLIASLRSSGWDWLQEGGPAGIAGRRLSLAALVLEVESAQLQATGAVSTPVIEWACANLRETEKPLPAERAWQAAAVGLMEHGDPAGVETHLFHANQRFAGDPRLLLADGWVQRFHIPPNFRHDDMVSGNPYFPNGPLRPVGPIAEAPTMVAYPQRTAAEWAAIGMDPNLPGFTGTNVVYVPHGAGMAVPAQVGMVPFIGRAEPSSVLETRLWKAREDYQHARGTAALAAEAELRLGELELLHASLKKAADHFAQALQKTDDRDLEYLAHYLAGLTSEQQLQPAEAAESYRRALASNPNGRAAIESLARVLDLQGKPDEAKAVRAQAIDPSAIDPWRTFEAGDLVSYAALIQELRQAVR